MQEIPSLTPFSLSGLSIVLTSTILIYILLRYGTTKLHRLWAIFNISVGLWGLGAFLIGQADTIEKAIVAWRIGICLGSGIMIPVFFYHVVCEFCGLKRRLLFSLAYLQGLLFSLIILFYDPLVQLRSFSSFYYLIGVWPVYHILITNWILLVWISFYHLIKIFKKESGLKRKQTVYFSTAMFTGFAGGTLNFFPLFGIDWYPYGNFAVPIYSAIATYAILSHHLLDIHVVVQKSTVYSLFITTLTLGYLVLVWCFERIFQTTFGYRNILLNLLVLSFIAFIFQPLKNKIQDFVDRYFFKGTAETLAKEKERLEQELQRMERFRTIGTLAAGMAHEIKNPLTVIKTYTTYFPQQKNDPHFMKKFTEVVGSEIEKVDLVIKDLLEFSKPRPPEMKPIEVEKVLSHALDLLQNESLKRKIDLSVIGIQAHTLVKGDKVQLEQVFVNILMNALESTEEGGKLEVRLSKEDKRVQVEIQDSGKGIPKEDLPYIFDPFFSKKEEGTGLGLAIAHRIIEEHKGRISVTSEVGKGTTFTVELPLSFP